MHPDATLHQLKAALPDGQLPSSYGVYLKNTLVALCHALEDHVLQTDQGNPLILVTFQEGKWYLQEADRYADLAQKSDHVVIAAMPDSGLATHPTGSLPNVSLVSLDGQDPLVREWNLIILDSSYAAMVLCYELPEEEYAQHGLPSRDIERKFYGLWTFDREQVDQSADILLNRIEPYDPTLMAQVRAKLADIKASTDQPQQDLSGVVTRIVNYLQTSQQQLITLQRQTREFWELEGQALRLSRNLNANKLQAFLRMAQRVDSQDPDNPVASFQVAALCETLGQLLDLPTIQLRRLRLAGLLFRIGLAQAPSDLFASPESYMDPKTKVLWPERALIGSQLLTAIRELKLVAQTVAQHLEHWDGSGYPEGLRGEDISLDARILGLASYFQELTQPRGSRPAMTPSEAVTHCQKFNGTRFDPGLIELLTTVIRLTEMGMMQLPDRPSHIPALWLDEGGSRLSPTLESSGVAHQPSV